MSGSYSAQASHSSRLAPTPSMNRWNTFLVGLARRETVVERHARIGRQHARLYHTSTTEVLVRRCSTRPRLVRGVLVGVFAWLYQTWRAQSERQLTRFAHWVHVVSRKTLDQMMLVS